MPGSVFSPLSVGTHGLLRDGAGLVQSALDILAVVGPGGEVVDYSLRPPERLGFARRAERDGLVAHLSDVLPMSADDLARKLQLPAAERLGRLTDLEPDAAVRRQEAGDVRALHPGKERA